MRVFDSNAMIARGTLAPAPTTHVLPQGGVTLAVHLAGAARVHALVGEGKRLPISEVSPLPRHAVGR